jgi:hypothetical protein
MIYIYIYYIHIYIYDIIYYMYICRCGTFRLIGCFVNTTYMDLITSSLRWLTRDTLLTYISDRFDHLTPAFPVAMFHSPRKYSIPIKSNQKNIQKWQWPLNSSMFSSDCLGRPEDSLPRPGRGLQAGSHNGSRNGTRGGGGPGDVGNHRIIGVLW